MSIRVHVSGRLVSERELIDAIHKGLEQKRMTIAWQQLGGWCAEGRNLSDDTLSRFAAVGGKWVVLLVGQLSRPNGEGAQWNHDHYAEVQAKCSRHGVRLGSWWNGWEGDPAVDARTVADFVHAHDAGPVVLDLEGDYAEAHAWKMPALLSELRALLPTRLLAVSTPGQWMGGMIWNGRTLNPPRSFYDMGVRWLPQWYSAYYKRDGHQDPVYCMTQLRDKGALDFNYMDVTAPTHRGLPLTFCKGCLEVSGLEGSSLADELERVRECWRQGLLRSPGLSVYLLENLSVESDWALLAAERGKLYVA